MSSEGSDSVLDKSRENLNEAVALDRRSGRRDRRRLRWVKPGFQVRFLVYAIVPSFLLLCVLGFSLVYFFEASFLPALKLKVSDLVYESLSGALVSYLQTLLSVSAVFFVFMSLIAFYLSFRFLGPVLALERALEAIQKNEKPKAVKLRPEDEFQTLIVKFNEALELEDLDSKSFESENSKERDLSSTS